MTGYIRPTPADIWRRLDTDHDPAGDDYLDGLIREAETKLSLTLKRRGVDWVATEPSRLTTSKLDYIRTLVIDAVTRIERNSAAKEGYSSESVGDYTYSIANAMEASANIWWPDHDIDLVAPKRQQTIGSIRLKRRW